MNTKKVKFKEGLTINSVEAVTTKLLVSLNKANLIELDFSILKKIDISGFQLLLSFIKEALESGKDVVFKGAFTGEFKTDLNNLTFDKRHVDTSEEFLLYMKGLI